MPPALQFLRSLTSELVACVGLRADPSVEPPSFPRTLPAPLPLVEPTALGDHAGNPATPRADACHPQGSRALQPLRGGTKKCVPAQSVEAPTTPPRTTRASVAMLSVATPVKRAHSEAFGARSSKATGSNSKRYYQNTGYLGRILNSPKRRLNFLRKSRSSMRTWSATKR